MRVVDFCQVGTENLTTPIASAFAVFIYLPGWCVPPYRPTCTAWSLPSSPLSSSVIPVFSLALSGFSAVACVDYSGRLSYSASLVSGGSSLGVRIRRTCEGE